MVISTTSPRWGEKWRSSPVFIVTAMAIALFTDVFLYSFLVPILPYMLESRLNIGVELTQRYSFILLSLSAGISVVASVPIGYLADRAGTKKAWLLSALALALVSTASIALATSKFTLFAGRVVQSFASTLIWVVGFSTIADNVQSEHMGKSYGAISMAVGIGTSAGPLLSGMLFQLGGYWLAWSSAFTVIIIDVILRLLMLERPTNTGAAATKTSSNFSGAPSDAENSPLLHEHAPTATAITDEKTGLSFYKCIFSQPQFVCGTISYMVYAMVVSGFDATLPLHVRDAFNWGSLQSGLIFVGLSGPSIGLAPLIGWWKDRIGTRTPTTLGFLGLVPLLWLAGVPGDDRFPWANQGHLGQVIYTISMTAVGIMTAFLCGAGTIEATQTVDALEAKHPGIFGPKSGYSRALSISSMGWTLGSFIGPIISGVIIERAGYYVASCVIASICAVSAVNAFCCLKSKSRAEYNANHNNSQ